MEKEILKSIYMYLRSGSIESTPPLSTILGNYGVNTIKFCEEFNSYTRELPNYFLLKVNIIIYVDKTFKFKVFFPSTSYLLKLVSRELPVLKLTGGGLKEEVQLQIFMKELLYVAWVKFGKIGIINGKSISKLLGTLHSMHASTYDVGVWLSENMKKKNER